MDAAAQYNNELVLSQMSATNFTDCIFQKCYNIVHFTSTFNYVNFEQCNYTKKKKI